MNSTIRTLVSDVRGRTVTTVRVALCLLFDTILFCLWLFIAWGCELLSAWAAAHHFAEWCVGAFKWISSLSTLVLAVVYMIADIVRAVREIKRGARENDAVW
jgi:hypothetical protein